MDGTKIRFNECKLMFKTMAFAEQTEPVCSPKCSEGHRK